MLKRIIDLTILILAGIIIASLKGQEQKIEKIDKQNSWVVPELPDALHNQFCHKDFLRFWRITTGGESGDWHLYNDEDKFFLSRWKDQVEWTALPGKLPPKKEKKVVKK